MINYGNRGKAWAYAMYPGERNYFSDKGEELAAMNLCALERASLLFFSFFFMAILIGEATEQRASQDIFALFLLIQAGVYATACHVRKRAVHPKRLTCCLLAYLASFSIGGIVLSGEYPGTGTAILAVLLMVQMLFILPPLYTGVLNAVTASAFFLITLSRKSWESAQVDLFHVSCILVLSLLLGWHMTRGRVEEAAHRGRLERLNDQLQTSVNTDFLTGLENRRKFQTTLNAVFQACAIRNASLGIIMIDIDSFKLYNDNYGHVQGDVCLQRVAQCLGAYCGDRFAVYRYGGEEFVALLTGECVERAPELASGFCRQVENLQIPHSYSHGQEKLTISVGIHAARVKAGETPEAYLEKADKAMYRSKYLGGNRATVFTPYFDLECGECRPQEQ